MPAENRRSGSHTKTNDWLFRDSTQKMILPHATNSESLDPMSQLLSETRRQPLLTAEEEVFLANRIAQGNKAVATLSQDSQIDSNTRASLVIAAQAGKKARERMILSNQGLVISVAKRHQGRGLELPDLVSEGNLGLIRATEKFDPEKGFKFSTYATWWIRQGVIKGIMDRGSTIRIPVNAHAQFHRLYETQEEFVEKHGREPTEQELQEILELRLKSAERAKSTIEAYKSYALQPR